MTSIRVSQARFGDMLHVFPVPLPIVGVDEQNVYFVDHQRFINGLPYVRSFSKEWQFKVDGTELWYGFEYETY